MEPGALKTWWWRAAIPACTAHLYMKKKYTASLFKPFLFRVFCCYSQPGVIQLNTMPKWRVC